MRLLRSVLITIVSIIVIVGMLTAVAPTTIKVVETVIINAKDEIIWNNLKYFENHRKWTAWEMNDSTSPPIISGIDGVVGTAISWRGEDGSESGTETITKMSELKEIGYQVKLTRPYKLQADELVTISDTTGGMAVTVTYLSKMDRPENVIRIFRRSRTLLHKKFSEALSRLKVLCEDEEKHVKLYRGFKITKRHLPARLFIGIRDTINVEERNGYYSGLDSFLTRNLNRSFEAITKAGMDPDGAQCSIFYGLDSTTGKADIVAATPVKQITKPIKGWEMFNTDSGIGLELTYSGKYPGHREAQLAMSDYLIENALPPPLMIIEEYVGAYPDSRDSSKWETKLFYYLK